MIYELLSDTSYLIPMYAVVFSLLLFVGFSSLIFFIISILKKSNAPKEEQIDERLVLYLKLIDTNTKDDDWMHSLDTFLVKYGVFKTDEDMALFSQYYPKFVAHPLVKKKPDLLKRFVSELAKKNESIHGKDFKKKLGI